MKSKNDVAGLETLLNEHVAFRGNSDTVNLLWAGYLVALAVEGILSADDYQRLNSKLKDLGREEVRELLIGYQGQFD